MDQVGDKAAEEVLDQPEARSQHQQTRGHGQGEPHIELREPLDSLLNPADGGAGKHGSQQDNHQGLQAGTVGEPGQLPCGIAELQREEAQGANGARDRGHHGKTIRQVTDRAIHPGARHDVHQEGAGTKGFTASFQDREGDRGGGSDQGPGQEPPVQKTHCQGGIHSCRCAAFDPFKHRRWGLEVIQRFGCRPEHTTTRQQGADQNSAPIEKFEGRLGVCSPKPEFADRADGKDQRDQKQQHHHPLPHPAQGITDHGLAGFGELLG